MRREMGCRWNRVSSEIVQLRIKTESGGTVRVEVSRGKSLSVERLQPGLFVHREVEVCACCRHLQIRVS
ncbi:hypothetical protein CgunFtcFv8_020262 [Champsocephalus gunnari]|uniref:Uncharacterized protein n=1 Tax=Champsocephalus gunnari TaxID=52237 RepID=A0AAN8ELH0_CHAGU|nr:hypothetical protein CgunFtcFv8_020262 [Champsocephalus gunnari]